MNLKKVIHQIRKGKLKEIMHELRWIYTYGLKYICAVFHFIILGSISNILALGGNIVGKNIIDAVTGYDSSRLLQLIFGYAVLQLLVIAASAVSKKVSAQISIKVNQEICADLYSKIIAADWEEISRFHSGDLLNRIDNDVSSVAASVLEGIPRWINQLVYLVGTFCVIFFYDSTLAILAIISAPLMIAFSRIYTRRVRLYNKEIREMNSEVTIFEEETFRHLQVIKSFGRGKFYKEKLSQVQEKYRKIKLEYNDFVIRSNMIMTLTGMMVAGVCLCWGGYRFWTGYITVGTLTLFLQLTAKLKAGFEMLMYMTFNVASEATAAGRLMAVTELPEEKYLCEKEVETLKKSKCGLEIQAEKISFRYKSGKEVIVQSDFSARAGEVIGLIGPSGEGKTSMLRILLGLISVQEGRVEIMDRERDLHIPVSAATRTFFSYVPQDNVMFFDTIVENMRIVKKDATEEEIVGALKQACAYEFVEALPEGIYSKIYENKGGFSEGQIQRLSIARALLSPAPILLLDEATSALDIATEKNFLQNLMEKNDERIVIFVTHRLEVLKNCDKIYKVDQKKIRSIKG